MSITLMSRVWECDLPPNLTLVLLAMADIARDDGSRCYPSVGFLAWKCGYSRRQIQNIIKELRAKAILLVVNYDKGGRGPSGRGHSTEYLIRLADVSPKQSYRSLFVEQGKGAIFAPLTVQSTTDKGEAHCTHKGEICDIEGCNLEHTRVQPTSPNTLLNVNDPLDNSLDEPDGKKSKYWETVLAILQQQVTRPSFETWLKHTRCITMSDEVVVIEVANTFVKEMLNDRMYSLIYQAAVQLSPGIKEVLFEVAETTEGIE